LAIILAIIIFLFALGAGIYIIKNASELSESTYHASGDAFVPIFWVWAYRIVGIWAIGLSLFILYTIIDTLFFS
jgi:hypothetical protein